MLTARAAVNESVPSYTINKINMLLLVRRTRHNTRFHSTCKKSGRRRVLKYVPYLLIIHKKGIIIFGIYSHTFYRKANAEEISEEMEEIRHKLEGCKAPRLPNDPLILPAQSRQQPAVNLPAYGHQRLQTIHSLPATTLPSVQSGQ